MSITFIFQHKELVIPAYLGSIDPYPSYLGEPLIRLSLCKVLNSAKKLKNSCCVPTPVRNIKSLGNSHGIFFHPFCNLYIEYV